MPFGRDHRPPQKSAKRSRNRSNDEWIDAVIGFNNESNLRSVDDVKTLFPAVKEGACLSFLKVVRDNSKRCKKSFRRLVAIRFTTKRQKLLLTPASRQRSLVRAEPRLAPRVACGRVLLEELTAGRTRERINSKRYGEFGSQKWRKLRARFNSLLQAMFEEIGGDRQDSRVLLQMLADCRAVRSLEIEDQPQSNARAKSLVISGLQDFFLEYMATKGGRTTEMPNAFEIVVCRL